jgi:hypothetical protein
MLAVVAIAAWLGVMGLFAGAVAPAAFAVLSREDAGRLVGALFPRYYGAGAGLGAVALAAFAAGAAGRPWRAAEAITAGLLALMLALTLYAWLAVLPAAQAARAEAARQGPASAGAVAFARLHRLSTALNGAVLLAGVGAVVLLARRPA